VNTEGGQKSARACEREREKGRERERDCVSEREREKRARVSGRENRCERASERAIK